MTASSLPAGAFFRSHGFLQLPGPKPGRPLPSPKAGVGGSGLRLEAALFRFPSSPPLPGSHRVEGEAQPSTKRASEQQRRPAPPAAPRPCLPARVRSGAHRPNPRARARGRGDAHLGPAPGGRCCGTSGCEGASRGGPGEQAWHSLSACRGTAAAFRKRIEHPGTDSPPAHAEPTASPTAAPSGFPAVSVTPVRGTRVSGRVDTHR